MIKIFFSFFIDAIFFFFQFFELSGKAQPKSTLTLKEVNDFLESMNGQTKETEQAALLGKILKKCTGDDLKLIWKLLDKDLKINIGPKFVFNAMHPKAFDGNTIYFSWKKTLLGLTSC